jgi:hypothetical protein
MPQLRHFNTERWRSVPINSATKERTEWPTGNGTSVPSDAFVRTKPGEIIRKLSAQSDQFTALVGRHSRFVTPRLESAVSRPAAIHKAKCSFTPLGKSLGRERLAE